SNGPGGIRRKGKAVMVSNSLSTIRTKINAGQLGQRNGVAETCKMLCRDVHPASVFSKDPKLWPMGIFHGIFNTEQLYWKASRDLSKRVSDVIGGSAANRRLTGLLGEQGGPPRCDTDSRKLDLRKRVCEAFTPEILARTTRFNIAFHSCCNHVSNRRQKIRSVGMVAVFRRKRKEGLLWKGSAVNTALSSVMYIFRALYCDPHGNQEIFQECGLTCEFSY
ncbi:unnamed protein product, partial [Nesidiocoris tenuis]